MGIEKYYTPTIEEFHIGFEFEELISGEAYKNVFGELHTNISTIQELIDNGEVRVKCLDAADIEECGWKTEDNEFWCNCFVLSGQLEHQNVTIESFYEDITMDNYSSWREVVFHGKIKNKSELKRLMKQLGIWE